MPLVVPTLDDRSYDALFAEARARIPVHTPEWTNFNDSDPGITILQLTCWLIENALYRINLIPARNRLKFLQLLDIPLRPAAAAEGVVTIVNERGPLATETLQAGLPLAAGPIGFVTRNGLDVLPVEASAFYRRELDEATERSQADALYGQLYGSQADEGTALTYYRTMRFDPPQNAAALPSLDVVSDTIDGLWLALLARPGDRTRIGDIRSAIAGRTLTLGLAPATSAEGRVLTPGGTAAAGPSISLEFAISTGEFSGDEPVYTPLGARIDGDPHEALTLAQIALPEFGGFGVWDDLDPLSEGVGDFPPAVEEDVASRLVAWVRIRVRAPAGQATMPAGLSLPLVWVGINAARVAQRVEVAAELVGTGSGEPDQRFTLVNRPVLAESVVLFVGGERWQRIDDLYDAPPEVSVGGASTSSPGTAADPRVFTVDRESGEIRCGDGLRGKRWPLRATIFASYAYGGTAAGNVAIGALRVSAALPPGFRLANPLPTWGGSDGESLAEAERAIPRVLRHRDRAVSREDFEDIIDATPGVDIGRRAVRASYHPRTGSPAPGVVTVVVIPRDPQRPEGPEPDRLFLDAVCRQIEPRRVLTTEVHVLGPSYVDIAVSIGVDVVPGAEIAVVREAVKTEIRRFLSPLIGGFASADGEAGWPFDHAVDAGELLVAAARVTGVAAVRSVLLWRVGTAASVPTVPIRDLQLPRLVRIEATVGDAVDITTSTAPSPTGPTDRPPRRLPVPTVPPEC